MTRIDCDKNCPGVNRRLAPLHWYLRRHTGRAILAVELATHLGIGGNHENKRRGVRRIVERLRNDGHRICADCHPTKGGYWLAADVAEWQAYEAARESGARFEFVAVKRMREAATDRSCGQGKLFADGERPTAES